MKLLMALLLSACAWAQTHVAISTRTGVTSEKVTLAHDSTNPVRIQACAIVINPTVAGNVTLQVAGTAATTTELTPTSTSPGGRTAKAKAYGNSNVGSGTAIAGTMKFSANLPFTLSLKSIRLSGNGTTKNVTAVISLDSSGDVNSAIYWAEDGQCDN